MVYIMNYHDIVNITMVKFTDIYHDFYFGIRLWPRYFALNSTRPVGLGSGGAHLGGQSETQPCQEQGNPWRINAQRYL